MNLVDSLNGKSQDVSQEKPVSQGSEKPKDVVTDVAQKNLSQEKSNDRSQYFSLLVKYGVPTVYIASIISTAATPVTTGVTVGYALDANCTGSNDSSAISTPAIVALVVSAFGAVVQVGEKVIYYFVSAEEKKEQAANDLLRKEQEEKRHKELSDLLMQTLSTVQRYQANKDQESFVKCLQAIKNIPESGSNDLKTRDEWLTTVIDMSNDELGLKTKLNSVRTLAKEIKKNEDVHTTTNENPKVHTNIGEGRGGTLSNYPQDAVFDNLNNFNERWADIEKVIGFSLDSIPTDGEIIDKIGNLRNIKEQDNTLQNIIIDIQKSV